MPNRIRYLFDSDVLITSKNFHYHPDFCPAFWDWIVAGHQAGVFFSIDKVKKELLTGREDPLHAWSQQPALSGFFLDSQPAIAKWGKLSTWAHGRLPPYIEAAKAKFLNPESADAWLIAAAAHYGNFVIITNEVPAPESKRDIKLPDAAVVLSVQTIKLPEVLSKHAGPNFRFKPYPPRPPANPPLGVGLPASI